MAFAYNSIVPAAPPFPTARDVSSRLLRWYRRNRRDLPWRRTRDPYAVWVSETMLQQTQVATVIPYFRRFLARFPTVTRLAGASLDDVLPQWAGLGYYARARNLHAAARQIVADHGGRIPDRVDALQSLPGVGRYTAGAVASIAFGRRAAVVDGNVGRVLARLFAIRSDLQSTAGKARLWALAGSLLPNRACGDFNQALMELGATVCTPANPRCSECPLRAICHARERDLTDQIPLVKPARALVAAVHVVAAICDNDRWLFTKRPANGMWGGLWELPTAPLNGGTPLAAVQRLAMSLGTRIASVDQRPFCRLTHVLTHRRITFVGHVCRLTKRKRNHDAQGRMQWRSLDRLAGLGLSTAMQRVLAVLRERIVRKPAPDRTRVRV